MDIKKAEFIISNTDYRKCPTGNLPEFAFIGRSNVGKSTLINMLTGRKGLAKTSATPGKTLLINHFKINDNWYIVDLPGYGYAKLGKSAQEKLQKIIYGYILHREQLTCVMLLIDCRHEPLKPDLEFIQTLGANGIPFAIVFTKLDKLSNRQWQEHLQVYKDKLSEEWEELPPIFTTSSSKNIGKEEVLGFIEDVLKDLKQPNNAEQQENIEQ